MESITVELSHERVHAKDSQECEDKSDTRVDSIRSYILVEGDISDEQRERLRYIASRCPVYKTLISKPKIVEEVEVVRPSTK